MIPAYRVVFFDVDSTLVALEGIDALANGDPRIAELTEAAMSGAVPIDEVYARRLEIVRPSEAAVESLAAAYVASMISDAPHVIGRLLAEGVEVHLVTAGIEQALLPLTRKLGLDERALHAVRLSFDEEGRYRDFDRRSFLARPAGKEVVVRDVRSRSHGRAAFVGDGVTDLDAKDAVDLFIGFGGVKVRERVREGADIYLEGATLSPLLPILLEGRHE